MPTISYDGQSFSIDGRRVWLVGGAMDYARIPHELWRRRIQAARQAGLNCIDTRVVWNVHEPSPGEFNFKDSADLRSFVRLVGQEGMFCILRLGPYVGGQWDWGGLPVWLHRVEGIKPREANGPFLEASARYLGAVMEQVRDLQVSASAPRAASRMPGGGGGPILLMQAEHQWLCDHADQSQRYLAEIVRYLRENGATCPIIESNNLWTAVSGAIPTWSGRTHLPASLRQLRRIVPDSPPLVSEYHIGTPHQWGQDRRDATNAQLHEYRMAGMLAAGASFSMAPFHGGTSFGFSGAFNIATDHRDGAPLMQAGGRGDKYLATKRLCTFASQFGHVFAHLNPEDQPAAVVCDEGDHALSIMHQRGAQGEIIFILKGEKDRRQHTLLLLPNGQALPVPLGKDRVAWIALNVRLGAATLNYTNLRPWAFIDRKMLVLFGPTGAQGLLAINNAPLLVNVPTQRKALVTHHEDFTIVVLNRQQVDASYVAGKALIVGAERLDEDGAPIVSSRGTGAVKITSDGTVTPLEAKAIKRINSPRLGKWEAAVESAKVRGEGEDWREIDGPKSLEALECDTGYGWYRLSLKSGRKQKVLGPCATDRVHVYQEGKLAAILGDGPDGARGAVDLKLAGTTVALADNLGHRADGWHFGETKGLSEHFYTVREARLGKPRVTQEQAPDLFALRGYWQQAREHERPTGTRLTWKIRPIGKQPLIVDITAAHRLMVLVNDEPVGAYDPVLSEGFARLVLHVGDALRAGDNRLTVALFETVEPRKFDAGKGVRVYQTRTNVTQRAVWAFAPMMKPDDTRFSHASKATGLPTWFRTRFSVSRTDVPLWLEPRGLSKGQIYLNGRNVGRYFQASRGGKFVGPQKRYYLPEPWLNVQNANTLMIFDEHGHAPNQCRLAYDAMG